MVFGDDHELSLVVDGIENTRCDDIHLLDVNIDSKFNFDKHVTNWCSRVNKQLQVIKQFRKLMTGQTTVSVKMVGTL